MVCMDTTTNGPTVAPQPVWFIDNLAYVHQDGDSTRGAFGVVELLGRRGDMAPLHVHRRDDECFFVLEGELELYVGEERLEVGAGRSALARRDVPHTYRIASDTARWLTITSPAGFERFILAAGVPADRAEIPTGQPVDPAELAARAAEHGIEILGPPGALPAGHDA
jgi:mannose-6-phosphate isomerase-like protein (cupin superfamily)